MLSPGIQFKTISPSNNWNGTLTWSGRNPPIDESRVTFKPIAHFAIPSFQDFNSTIDIPVVAFCKDGIDHVTFWVEGNTIDVNYAQMVTPDKGNPFEAFVVQLVPIDIDGALEVCATVYPNNPIAQPRTIKLSLFSNRMNTLPRVSKYVDSINGSDTIGNGTSNNPYATIYKAKEDLRLTNSISGGNILLRTGDYNLSDSKSSFRSFNDRYLTIKPDTCNQPRIVDKGIVGSLEVQRIKFENIKLDTSISGAKILISTSSPMNVNGALWIDNLEYIGPGAVVPNSRISSDFKYTYFTNLDISNSQDGIKFATLIRNVNIHNIGSDAVTLCNAVMDVTVSNCTSPPQSGFHADIWQWFGAEFENLLFYNVRVQENVDAQGIFFQNINSVRDVAIINSILRSDNNVISSQLINLNVSHLLMIHNTFDSRLFIYSTTNNNLYEYVEIIKNIFGSVCQNQEQMLLSNNTNIVDSNLFISNQWAFGNNPIIGNPQFSNNTLYIPLKNGNLKTTTSSKVLGDNNGTLRQTRCYLGAKEL